MLDSGQARSRHLLLITTLVAGLTKQFTVLLLGHTLAALLNNRAHNGSSQTDSIADYYFFGTKAPE
ncbi:hypothetical protein J2T21_003440 [Paeniglutamicibacter psychrophenolicus]|jgi:hypothetical protein|nr:hypothetical protein [Paeniglutamicibacter psychrophenolicus]